MSDLVQQPDIDFKCKIKKNNTNYRSEKVKYIDTKQSNKRNNQNSKSKRQDYNMK